MTRARGCLLCGIWVVVIGLLSCLGYGPLSFVEILGMAFLDFFDFITNSIMMPILALLTCILVGFVVKTRYVIDEVESSGCEFRTKRMYSVMVKWVSPVVMVIILAVGVLGAAGYYSI